jgi:single-stranded DNA-specific DHH superfamily exonuclease
LKDRPFEKIILFDGVISPGVDYIRIQDVAAFDQWGAPFGQGLEEPLFLVPQIPVAKVNVLKEKHIRCQFSDGTTAIGFNLAEEMSKLKNQNVQNFDALVTPELNRFRDKITVQLKIKHVGSLETVNIILRS